MDKQKSQYEKIKTWLREHGINTVPKPWWVYAWLIIGCAYFYYWKKLFDYIDENYNSCLMMTYKALGHRWINILVLVGVVCLTCNVARTIANDKLFSWKRFLVELMALWILIYKNYYVFAEVAFGVNYWHLLLTINVGLILLEFTKYYLHRKTDSQETSKPYITDDDFNPEEDYERRHVLAEVIVKKALATDLSKESFSIGITGGWGTGKTTMLNSVKDAVGGSAYIVEFNPWNSQTASQIINDFFSEIRSSLSKNYRTLSKPIMRYATLLSDIELNPVEKWVTKKVIGYVENDLSASKDLLSKELKKIDKPIVVLIDDTDRLEGDEMFEVLRLVRNTAKLPNVIYFVAFDKSYLVEQLERKHIPEAAQYIEKIFQLEIAMPYAEKYLMVSALYYDLNMMQGGTQVSDWLYKKLSYAELKRAAEILGSYRQVKRFTRLYMTQLAYMKKVFVKSELNFADLFWLTIIQQIDYVMYENMFRNPEMYLEVKDKGNNAAYSLKVDAKISNEKSKEVLEKLLKDEEGKIYNGLRYVDNYMNYFYMGMEKGRISLEQFEKLLEAGDKTDEMMIDVAKAKGSQSMYHRLSSYQITYDMNKTKAYYTVLTAWMNCQKHQLMAFLFEERLKPYNIKEEDRKTFQKWFVKRMEHVIGMTNNYLQVSSVLGKIYPTEMYYEDVNGPRQLSLLTQKDVECLSRLTIREYIKKHPESEAWQIVDKGTTLGQVYRNFSVIEVWSEEADYYKNLIIDEVISHFSTNKSKGYNKAKHYFELSDEDRRLGYVPEIEENIESNIQFLFGSKNKYNEYLIKCFVNPNEKRKKGENHNKV